MSYVLAYRARVLGSANILKLNVLSARNYSLQDLEKNSVSSGIGSSKGYSIVGIGRS